jgi:hypothetical protein
MGAAFYFSRFGIEDKIYYYVHAIIGAKQALF